VDLYREAANDQWRNSKNAKCGEEEKQIEKKVRWRGSGVPGFRQEVPGPACREDKFEAAITTAGINVAKAGSTYFVNPSGLGESMKIMQYNRAYCRQRLSFAPPLT